jgi:RHS repeat-associated protein
VKRTVDGETTAITYDEWKPIVEWKWENGGSQLVAWNLYGPGADEILVRNQPSTAGYMYYHLDALGNVAFLLSDTLDGLEKYTYDVFGQPTITGWNSTEPRPTSSYGNRFLFTGREYIYTLGLYDYRHRFYNPHLGRFIQTDPIGLRGDPMNLYRYCSGNPIGHTDPTGLQDLNATLWNRLRWFEGGSSLSAHGDDLLRQGQAYLAPPTGNYQDHNVDHHTNANQSKPGITRYTVDNVKETDGKLIITPALNWWVRPEFKNTKVVIGELEHVNRYLWWQSKHGDGQVAVNSFNRNPKGVGELKTKMGNERFIESVWQDANIHNHNRHSLDKNPELSETMDPAVIQQAIKSVRSIEEPQIGNPYLRY